MAEDLISYMEKLEARKPPEFTTPQVYYGAQEDSLTIYLRSDESYAYRLNTLVTLFLSFDRQEVVGCQVKGLRRKLASDGTFGIAIIRGDEDKLELGMFFHLLAYETLEAEPRNRLVELGQRTKGMKLDAKRLELSSC